MKQVRIAAYTSHRYRSRPRFIPTVSLWSRSENEKTSDGSHRRLVRLAVDPCLVTKQVPSLPRLGSSGVLREDVHRMAS